MARTPSWLSFCTGVGFVRLGRVMRRSAARALPASRRIATKGDKTRGERLITRDRPPKNSEQQTCHSSAAAFLLIGWEYSLRVCKPSRREILFLDTRVLTRGVRRASNCSERSSRPAATRSRAARAFESLGVIDEALDAGVSPGPGRCPHCLGCLAPRGGTTARRIGLNATSAGARDAKAAQRQYAGDRRSG